MKSPVTTFQYFHQNQVFQCQCSCSHNKKNRIILSITPDKLVKIRTPHRTSLHCIQKVLDKHITWILSQLSQYPTNLRYINAEHHYYLGKPYPLHIEENIKEPQQILLKENCIYLAVRQNTPLWIYSLLTRWYRMQAFQTFSQRLDYFQPRIPWIDWENARPLLRIKKMTRQWGSYSRKNNGIITLNQHLIKTKPTAIDYVILHELCHAREFNHSKAFYTLLETLMPDWHQWKAYLRENSLLFNLDQKPD